MIKSNKSIMSKKQKTLQDLIDEIIIEFKGIPGKKIGDFDSVCIDWNAPRQLTKTPEQLKEWFSEYLERALIKIAQETAKAGKIEKKDYNFYAINHKNLV